MRQFPSIPRLTIVVPVGEDIEAFETSLVSVLENRPDGAEVIVAHDGSYDDPFDLDDEVRFVCGVSDRMVDLVAQAATAARGQFVHVVAAGVRASDQWTEAAVKAFDDPEVGAVAPVVSSEAGNIVAAGWQDRPSRLCDPVTSKIENGTRRRRFVGGPFLAASFWRREVIRLLSGTFSGDGLLESSYLYGMLTEREGWRCRVAEDCRMTATNVAFLGCRSGRARGRELRAIRQILHGGTWGSAIAASARAVAAATLGGGFAEAFGQALAPAAVPRLKRQIQLRSRPAAPQRSVIPMPLPAAPRQTRRSA